MKILLLGIHGQVGWELHRALAPLGTIIAADRRAADFENLPALRDIVRDTAADIIVNAAAYTAVDLAESETQKAYRINAEAVRILADEAQKSSAWLVHYSTDYVFDGARTGTYIEVDDPEPMSVYGSSKLAGEAAIQESGCKHLILRTSWVYAARGKNFLKTILQRAQQQDFLQVIADQIGAPTHAALIADITAWILYTLRSKGLQTFDFTGIYHLTPHGVTSWFQYAQFIIREAQKYTQSLRMTPAAVVAITTDALNLPARRPANSQLNCEKIQTVFNLTLPHWQHHAARTVAELLQSSL